MKRKLIIIITSSLIVIAGIVILIISLVNRRSDINPELVIQFCERNPEALVCTEDTLATNEDFAHDMFLTLIGTYSEDYSDDFCNDYFVGNVNLYCIDSKNNIMPLDTLLISDQFTMIEISEGIYDVETRYTLADAPAWTFRIAIVELDNVYVFSGISYYQTPSVENLHLTNSIIDEFMVDMIEESDDGILNYCETYFTGDAQDTCETDILLVAPDSTITDHSFNQLLDMNKYEFEIYNDLETIGYRYTLTFVEVDEEILISELTVVLITP